jgi:hypothetical protein
MPAAVLKRVPLVNLSVVSSSFNNDELTKAIFVGSSVKLEQLMQEPIVLFLHSVGTDGQFEVETAGRYRPDLERFADRVDKNAFEVGKWHAIRQIASGSISLIVRGESLPELPSRIPPRSWSNRALRAS